MNDGTAAEALRIGNICSPPLLPDVKWSPSGCNEIIRATLTWAETVLESERKDLVWHMCWDDKREKWEREVMFAIFDYYRRGLDGHEALHGALRLAALNHLMTHTLNVHKDDVEPLFQHMENPDYHGRAPGENVSPRLVDMAVQTLVFPFVERLAQETLSALQKLLLNSDESQTNHDLCFCLAFVSLFVLSKTQISVLERAIVSHKDRDGWWTMEEAEALVCKMEKELGDHIIVLCKHKFRPRQKERAARNDAHSSTFRLFSRILEISKEHGEFYLGRIYSAISDVVPAPNASTPKQLGDIDRNTFRAKNTKRLLFKFFDTVFGNEKVVQSH